MVNRDAYSPTRKVFHGRGVTAEAAALLIQMSMEFVFAARKWIA